MRRLWVKVAILAASIWMLAPRQASAADVCIAEKVRTDWSACPTASASTGTAPTPDRIAQAKALCAQKDWKGCGAAYDRIYADDPSGTFALDAARESEAAWAEVYQAAHRNGPPTKGAGALPGAATKKSEQSKYAPLDLDEEQRAMVASFGRYACVAKPNASTSASDRTRFAEVLFARARTMFEARHWDEAALGFREIALEYPNEEVGIFASQLYLEALNILGARIESPRPDCYTDIAADVPKFLELYCAGANTSKNEEQCAILERIELDIERLAAEKAFEAANRVAGTQEALALFRDAAKRYLAIWEKHGKAACEKARKATDEGCARNDEILANAASAFQAARNIDAAIAVRKILLEPRYHLNDTELARQAVHRIARSYHALFMLDDAATWYERFADENPKAMGNMGSAVDALSGAIELRLALGQTDSATRDAELFDKLYGSKMSAAAATNWCSLGHHFVSHEDWAAAQKALSGAMGAIDKNAPPDRSIVAHAELARALSKQGRNDAATKEYEKVRAAAKNLDAIVQRLANQSREDDRQVELLARRAALVDAIAEADFFFAEAARAALAKDAFPVYAGANDPDQVRTWVDKEAPAFIDRRRKAAKAVIDAYRAIASAPAERANSWATLASARAFELETRIYADVVSSPYPATWRTTGPTGVADVDWPTLRSAYRNRLMERATPLEQELRTTARSCLALGADSRARTTDTRSCEGWLARHDSGFHPIEELIDPATRIGIGGSEQRPEVLTKNGDPAVLPPPSLESVRP